MNGFKYRKWLNVSRTAGTTIQGEINDKERVLPDPQSSSIEASPLDIV